MDDDEVRANCKKSGADKGGVESCAKRLASVRRYAERYVVNGMAGGM